MNLPNHQRYVQYSIRMLFLIFFCGGLAVNAQEPNREEVFLIESLADKDGQTLALLKNAAGNRGVSMRWIREQLPYFTQWKNTASREDGYVTGLEPGTGFPFNRRIERQFSRVPKLLPGQIREFILEFGVHDGLQAVKNIEASIKKIQNGQQIERVKQPQKI